MSNNPTDQLQYPGDLIQDVDSAFQEYASIDNQPLVRNFISLIHSRQVMQTTTPSPIPNICPRYYRMNRFRDHTSSLSQSQALAGS
jgi:hypothetical protein